jgi:hypothetical protein
MAEQGHHFEKIISKGNAKVQLGDNITIYNGRKLSSITHPLWCAATATMITDALISRRFTSAAAFRSQG